MSRTMEQHIQTVFGSLVMQVATANFQLEQATETLAAAQAALKESEEVCALLKAKCEVKPAAMKKAKA